MNPYQELFEKQQVFFKKELQASTARQRIRKLRKLKKWILEHQSDIRLALKKDFQKPKHEVDASEIMPVVHEIKDAITHLHGWMRPKKVPTPMSMIGTRSWVYYEPKGVSLILAPWNFPFMLTVSPLVSAIAAGCTSIIKPSEYTPNTTALLTQMMETLFDEAEIAVVDGDHTVAQALTSHPFDHIFFTGSPEVGKKVMHAAADHLTSVTLELGGRNPLIIDPSANLKDTARKLIWGKYFNAGQSCMSPNYVMVHEKIYDKFQEALVKAYQKAFPEHYQQMDKSPDFSRVIHERHQARLKGLIDDTVAAGAEILIGGDTGPDNYLAPTVLKGVQVDHPIMQEEIFGPIMPLMKYSHLDDCLKIIDSIEKPLGLYVFAKKKSVIDRVIQHTSSGSVLINETTIAFAHPGLPFGGVNHSGIGKAHGHAGFLAFTNEKPVLKQNTILPSTLLIHPPYTNLKNKLINIVMRYF